MIDLKIDGHGVLRLALGGPEDPVSGWVSSLLNDPFFCSEESDTNSLPKKSGPGDEDEEWSELSVPDVVNARSELRERFKIKGGVLTFHVSDMFDFSVLVNLARLKLAGASEKKFPLKREQFEFYTALQSFALSACSGDLKSGKNKGRRKKSGS